jgi:hypothetical protein
MSANWALVMLLEPFMNAFFVVQMTARHQDSLIFEVFLTDCTSGEFFGSCLFVNLAVFISDGYFGKVFNGFCTCWRIS